MFKRLVFIGLLMAAVTAVQASVITLRSGQQIKGEVVVSNDEVVIVKNSAGARFQYPAAEVVSITDEEVETEQKEAEAPKADKPQGKRMTFLIALTGGGAVVPQDHAGGHIGGELMIGSRYIGRKEIFLGGGIGVHGMFVDGKTYTFLPLQIALKVPFLEGKHSPVFGANIGYGFGVSRNCSGGIYSALELGYRYAFSTRSSLLVAARTQFQQAKIDAVETITDDGVSADYVSRIGRSFVTIGVHLALTF